MAEDAVSRKISKLRDEGKSQDEAVAQALSMERRGELNSPPTGVQGFTQTPDPDTPTPATPNAFTQTPSRSDPETAPPAQDDSRPNLGGLPGGVQQNTGAEQRGADPMTKRASDGRSMSGGGDDRPDAVQNFSDAEV